MMWLWMAAALAGYGDAEGGYPRPNERELHLWTNAARMDPSAFNADYMTGGCRYVDFKPDEKTPKLPLAWNVNLNEAARFHADDMFKHNKLTHDSSDGTKFENRLPRFYSAYAIGENVAMGYGTPYVTMMQGWMCSSGHRANIMEAGFDEFGGGIHGDYMTQDFGLRNVELPILTVGISRPAEPTNGSANFMVDLNGITPDAVYVVIDGEPSTIDLKYGVANQGVYAGDVEFTAGGCHIFWFEAEHSGGIARFPEDGAYGFGGCEYDDAEAQWISRDTLAGRGGLLEGVDDGTLSDGDVAQHTGGGGGKGCDTTGAGGVWLSLAALLAGRRRP